MRRGSLALWTLLVLAAPVRADEGTGAIVEVVAAGGASTLAAMADRIRALEARLPLRVRWAERPAIDAREIVAERAESDSAFARVWLDLTSPERALLFIANEGHDRFLVRAVPIRSGYDELARESLATIVESALDALLAGGEIGVDRAAAERVIATQVPAPGVAEPQAPTPQTPAPAAPATPSPARTPARDDFLVALGYRGDAVADGLALRHGVQLALDARAVEWLWLTLSAHYFAPVELGDDEARVRQHGGGARAAIGVAGELARALHGHAGLGAGVDLFELAPIVDAGAGLIAEEAFLVARPIATAFAGGGVRLATWIELRVSVGLDLDLLGHHFDVQVGETQRAAVSPWLVHPYLVLGAGAPW